MIITGHAIDAASNRCRGLWKATRRKPLEERGEEEGLHAWLRRMVNEAISMGERTPSGKLRYAGMKFTIEGDALVDVIRIKK